MKRALPAVVAALSPVIAGADIGIGASLRDSEAAVYLPIESSAEWRIEPYLSWSDQDLSGPVDQSQETSLYGVGLFRKLEIHDRTQAYLGARLAWTEFEVTSSDPATPDLEGDGYSFEPTLGIGYRIAEPVTVSLEALVFVRRTDEDFGGADFDRDSIGTSNRILLRVYFPP
jgi:hypothetical protein